MAISASEYSFTIRALELGNIVLIAFDGLFDDKFDRLRLRQARKIVAEAHVDDFVGPRSISFLKPLDGASPDERLIRQLAEVISTDETAGVMVLPLNATTQVSELSFLKGRSRVGRPILFSARSIGAAAGAPVGNIVSICADPGHASCQEGLPVPVIGGRKLRLIESRQVDELVFSTFRLPTELFDGQTHAFLVAPASTDIELASAEWRCAPAHDLANTGALQRRASPEPFPDHEIPRIAAFAANPARHSTQADLSDMAAWRTGQSRPESPPVRLLVFDLTLFGALSTPAAVQLRELHHNWLETVIVLPTREAIAFGAEMTRATAVSQFIDIMTTADIPAYLRAQPDDAVIVTVAGGSALTMPAIDEIYAIIAGASSGSSGAITHRITAGPLTLDITESASGALDLSQGVGVFSKQLALQHIAVGRQLHEGARVPSAHLTATGGKSLTVQLQRTETGIAAPRADWVIDAQSIDYDDRLMSILHALRSASISVVLIASYTLARKVSDDALLKDIKILVSPYGEISVEDEGELLRSSDRPVIYLSLAMLDVLSQHSADFIDFIQQSVSRTVASSTCTITLRKENSTSDEQDRAAPLGAFRCVKTTL